MATAVVQNENGEEIERVQKRCFDWLCPCCYKELGDTKRAQTPQCFYLKLPYYDIRAVKLRKRKHLELLKRYAQLVTYVGAVSAMRDESIEIMEELFDTIDQDWMEKHR